MLQADALILCASTLAIVLTAVAFTAILRVGGIGARSVGPGGYRGTAIAGGIVAGVLLGPGVFGQLSPGWHREMFRGGGAELWELDDLVRRQRADLKAMELAGVTPIAIEELQLEHEAERASALDALKNAEAERRGRLNAIASGFACVCVFSACAGMAPRRRGARRAMFRAARKRPGTLVAAGALYTLVGIGIPTLVTYAFARRDPGYALALGVLFGCVGVSGSLLPDRRWASILIAGSCGSIGAMIAPSVVTFAIGGSGVLGLVIGARLSRQWKRRFVAAVRWSALPALAAMLTVQADIAALPSRPLFWYAMIASALWCSDGRWFASWVSQWWRARRDHGWASASRLVDAGSGTASLVFALAFFNAGVIGEVALASALAGAALVELFRGFRAFAGPLLDG